MNENKVIILSKVEKEKCLKEIIKKIKRILFVYEQGEKNTEYDYKIFITSLIFYVYSSDALFGGDLINIIVNLNTILINDFNKNQLKKIVFETLNIAEYLLKNVDGE